MKINITIEELIMCLTPTIKQIVASQLEEMKNQPDFLTKDQAREYLGGISMVTLDKLIRDGKITPCRPSPDRITFLRSDLKAFMLSTKQNKALPATP